MVDITLIAPTSQVQTVSAGGQQTQSATQTGVPAGAHLSPGALLSGLITGKDASGNYMLRTEQGTFSLHSTPPLTYNSEVVIHVDTSAGSNATARIVSVNGEAFATFSAPASEEGDSLSPSLLARTTPQSAHATTASMGELPSASRPLNLSAVTVPLPAGTAQAAGVPAAPITPGTPVMLHLASQGSEPTASASPATAPVAAESVPSPSVASSVPTSSTSTTQPQLPAAPTLPASPAATSAPPLAPAQNTAAAQGQNMATPAAPAAAPINAQATTTTLPVSSQQPTPPAPLQSPQYAAYAKTTPSVNTLPSSLPPSPVTLEATVLATHPEGEVTLQTSQGILSVKPESLPQGTVLVPTMPIAITLPASAALTPETPADSLATALQQILSAAQAKNPAAGNELLARLPTIGPEFISSSVSFMASLLQGNGRKLLGEAITSALHDAGKEEVLEAFDAHAANVAQQFGTPASSGQNSAPQWQSLILPFVYQGALQEARFYVKRDAPQKDKDGRKTKGDTRFIVEVSFSDMGELQLDGLVLPKDNATVFDLVVRTQTAFTPEERMDITQIYNHVAELTGYRGNLAFQVTKDFPVKPLSEIGNLPARDLLA